MTYARKLRRQNLRRQSSQPFQPKLLKARTVRGRAGLFPELRILGGCDVSPATGLMELSYRNQPRPHKLFHPTPHGYQMMGCIDDPMPQPLATTLRFGKDDCDRLISWFQSAVAKRFDNAMLGPISIPAPPEAFTIETLRQAIERMRELSIPPNPDGTYTFDVHRDSVAAQLFQAMGEDDGCPLGILKVPDGRALPADSDDAPAD